MVSRNYIGEQGENINSTKKDLSAGTERQQHQAQSSEQQGQSDNSIKHNLVNQ